jgi:hypothetical protein
MATKKVKGKPAPEPEKTEGRRVTIVATDKHPHKIAGRVRTVHPRKAERLIGLGWFEKR